MKDAEGDALKSAGAISLMSIPAACIPMSSMMAPDHVDRPVQVIQPNAGHPSMTVLTDAGSTPREVQMISTVAWSLSVTRPTRYICWIIWSIGKSHQSLGRNIPVVIENLQVRPSVQACIAGPQLVSRAVMDECCLWKLAPGRSSTCMPSSSKYPRALAVMRARRY